MAVALGGMGAGVAYAQQTAPQDAQSDAQADPNVIIVTAQRQSQSLQDVPIAVSAFSAQALESQQIKNSSDLQLTLPNVTFTKGNFTGSSFTIRGIGDLCVGTTCDAATGIHVNDQPVLGTRLFETEFFDLERIEVLRGPQGTLYGRNATSGVINFITAKPDLTGIHASGEAEYGNYNSIKGKGMFNLPIGETLGLRVAGTYLNRDGYTKNLYDGKKVDGRDLYAVRGSLRWEPTSDTTVDLMGYYFHEKDNRARIQKQLCHRDPTGVLGCLPDSLAYETTNGNSTLAAVLTSQQGLGIILGSAAAGAAYGLGSIYGPDTYTQAGNINPADKRQVYTDFNPTYKTTEEQYSAKIEHHFSDITASLSGIYKKSFVDSQQDYNLAVGQYTNRTPFAVVAATIPKVAAALFPSGPGGQLCTSASDPNGVGAFGGKSVCAATALDFDRSIAKDRQYAGELIVDSSFDGMFNFLLGGSYVDAKATNVDYYVNAFGLDYFSGVVGGLATGNIGYLGTPFYRNNTKDFRLKSYGIFGETYFQFTDQLKLTVGLRYNHDAKSVSARTTLFGDSGKPVTVTNAQGTSGVVGNATTSAIVPYAATDFTQALNYAALDFDSTLAGIQSYQNNKVSFGRLTGRAVLDYQVTPDNLVYVSYSRGYKSGGINPPLSPIFAVPTTFGPETVNAFEIGSKNQIGSALQLNVTAFYYDYKALQLSRIVARTSVNDNVDARIYGLEAEAIVRPSRNFAVNMGFSYLNTKVVSDKFLSNPRDPSGGRADAVIIKDITNGSNCAVIPTVAGNAAGTNAFVGAVNGALGLRAPTAFPSNSGLTATGAYSVCQALAASAIAPSAALAAGFGTAANGTLPFQVLSAGVAVNIKGNKLPQAPNVKWSAGAQYTAEFGNGYQLVPRVDLAYTGDSFGNIFNGHINKISGYAQVNAQIQLNAPEDRFFVRGFVQNLFDSNATTGLYVTDQSSGLFTNIFTLEPRRYGIAAGFKF
ncbi:TonB-dependent receptor [Novosphingobium tardum]|uniref:TonB-dependent receptor n=1 Tax=Novosphingobium tardum TaxID=1538021 RepID=A0ABV8RTI7_9SPHN